MSRARHLLQNYNLFHLSYRELCRVLNDRFCLTVLCGVLVCLYVEMSLTLTLNYLEKVNSDKEYLCLDLLVWCRLWPNHVEFNMKILIWTKSCHVLCFPFKTCRNSYLYKSWNGFFDTTNTLFHKEGLLEQCTTCQREDFEKK